MTQVDPWFRPYRAVGLESPSAEGVGQLGGCIAYVYLAARDPIELVPRAKSTW